MKNPWSTEHGKRNNRYLRSRVKNIILSRVLTLPGKGLWIKVITKRKETNPSENSVVREVC